MSPAPVTLDPLAALDAPASFSAGTHEAIASLDRNAILRRIWARDATVWRNDPREITDRLGWLDVMGGMRRRLGEIRDWSDALRAGGIRDVVLLGMGGSSLAPEVFRRTFPAKSGRPTLHVLDTTSPSWIRRVTAVIDPRHTHFLVASKSGTTIEVDTLFAHFRELVQNAGVDAPGQAFSAITGPGTPLVARAREDGFRATFVNPPDIGGRFSALSLFGLVPAAVLGVDLEGLLASAEAMAASCGPDVPTVRSPGAVLGAVLGAAARDGRDKMTLLTASAVSSFGLWAEQLIAESTGKDGTGIVPVVDEPEVAASEYGDDRVFVAVGVAPGEDAAFERRVDGLRRAGQPVYRTWIGDLAGLGGEMFRWEMATSIAGHLLGIHPFDQPDVQAAKTRTSEILAALGRGEEPAPVELGDARALLGGLRPGDWVGVMVYGDPTRTLTDAVADLRAGVERRWRAATTFGLGPRFLHSTGQLHKGGANRGVFLQIVLPEEELPVPGRPWGFRELIRAQADGDLAALRERGRRAARLTASRDPASTVRSLVDTLRS